MEEEEVGGSMSVEQSRVSIHKRLTDVVDHLCPHNVHRAGACIETGSRPANNSPILPLASQTDRPSKTTYTIH